MKFAAPDVAAPAAAEDADRSTRERVCREVLQRGPVTATELAGVLGLTSAGVRRHLDGLLADGLVTVWDAEANGPNGRRGRGRPARRFVLTDAGHAAMTAAYDDLAAAALQFISDLAGEDAVRRFATARAGQLTSRYGPSVAAAGADPHLRAEALARALSTDGYAATTRSLPVAGGQLQLCQGHCPVQHVAERFPQLCEAETTAFSQLLGVHVQRLATLAHGAHVCTTHVPAAKHTPPAGTPAPERALNTSETHAAPTPPIEESTRR